MLFNSSLGPCCSRIACKSWNLQSAYHLGITWGWGSVSEDSFRWDYNTVPTNGGGWDTPWFVLGWEEFYGGGTGIEVVKTWSHVPLWGGRGFLVTSMAEAACHWTMEWMDLEVAIFWRISRNRDWFCVWWNRSRDGYMDFGKMRYRLLLDVILLNR